jgi:hypothetical protein
MTLDDEETFGRFYKTASSLDSGVVVADIDLSLIQSDTPMYVSVRLWSVWARNNTKLVL